MNKLKENAWHTPTPWRLNGKVDIYAENNEGQTYMLGAIISEANAAFIIRAVNAHAALVEACKALEQFETTPDKDAVLISYKAIERARKALKLVEEA